MARKKDQQRRETDEAEQRQRREAQRRRTARRIQEPIPPHRTPAQLWELILSGARIDPLEAGLPLVALPNRRDAKRTKRLLELLRHVEGHAPKVVEPQRFSILWEMAGLEWVRPVTNWKPAGRSRHAKLRSLADHLFVLYPVPPFLYSVLEEYLPGRRRRSPERLRQGLRLFVELGRGKSVNWLVAQRMLPVPLTRRMGHLWLQQKADLDWVQAIRSAQVQAFGGDRRLARAICSSFLGRDLLDMTAWPDEEAFWQRVVQWLAKQAMLDPEQVGPLCDYIQHEHRNNPAWSLSGRTVASLERGMFAWHGELARLQKLSEREFKPSGFEEGRFEIPHKGRVELWTVQEVLTSQELGDEGRALRHCVYSYRRSVSKGRCSIWSMKLHDTRKLTIEVHNAAARIVQARGSKNRVPTREEMGVMRLWAHHAMLDLALQHGW